MDTHDREVQEQPGSADPRNRKPASGEPSPPEEYLRMKEWIRQAQADAERTRDEIHHDIEDLRSELQKQDRRTKGTGWTAGILLLALMGACAYGYFTLRGHGAMLAQFPEVQKSIAAIGQRVGGTEDQLHSWASNWDGLTDRVGKVEKHVDSNLRAAKDFATIEASKMQQELQSEMDNRTRSTDAKLNQLEASQQQDHVQLAALQQRVGDVRNEAHQQLASAETENSREFGDVRHDLNQNRDDVSTVARHLDRQRVDFEVSKKQSHDLTPGLAFTVLKTDVSHQRVDGYLHLIPEGRFLWIHSQGIEQPMLFHLQGDSGQNGQAQDDQRAYELVFTRVAQNGVVGYVLMPRWPEAALPAAGDSTGPQPSSASIR